jgi:hypothetical protein
MVTFCFTPLSIIDGEGLKFVTYQDEELVWLKLIASTLLHFKWRRAKIAI